MKKLIFFFLFLSISVFGQNDSIAQTVEKNIEKIEEVTFKALDEVPIFPGCEGSSNSDLVNCFSQKVTQHIINNFYYPDEAIDEGIQGRVWVKFVINSEGFVADIKTGNAAKILQDEARRIIQKLPRVTPGKVDGKPVNTVFSIPVTFQLE